MTIENSMIDWDSKLLEALWAYCIAYKVTIWFTPLRLVYAIKLLCWLDLEHSIQGSIWMKWVVTLLWRKIWSKMMCMCDHDWEQECEERRDSWWVEDSFVEDTQDIQFCGEKCVEAYIRTSPRWTSYVFIWHELYLFCFMDVFVVFL